MHSVGWRLKSSHACVTSWHSRVFTNFYMWNSKLKFARFTPLKHIEKKHGLSAVWIIPYCFPYRWDVRWVIFYRQKQSILCIRKYPFHLSDMQQTSILFISSIALTLCSYTTLNVTYHPMKVISTCLKETFPIFKCLFFTAGNQTMHILKGSLIKKTELDTEALGFEQIFCGIFIFFISTQTNLN